MEKVLPIKDKKKARKVLANNIRYYRLKKNWSQEEFAYRLGTTPAYVSNLENGKRNTRIDYIDHIADTLEVSLEQLFTLKEVTIRNRVLRK